MRCVEFKGSALTPRRFDARNITTTHAVCDLIPHSPPQKEYIARVCLEMDMENTPPPRESPVPLLTSSVDFEPYFGKKIDISKESCSICVQSNPDVSRIPSPPIKSCLKKNSKNHEFTSSISLPSMEVAVEELKSKSDIDQVNRQWNEAYDSPETSRMLSKISNDLDFLLNRTQFINKNNHTEEDPT